MKILLTKKQFGHYDFLDGINSGIVLFIGAYSVHLTLRSVSVYNKAEHYNIARYKI